MWPFRKRKPKVLLIPGECLETWRVGDVAEAIADNWHHESGAPIYGIAKGARAIVTKVAFDTRNPSVRWLALAGFGQWWSANSFRKIVDVGVEEPRRKGVKPPRIRDKEDA